MTTSRTAVSLLAALLGVLGAAIVGRPALAQVAFQPAAPGTGLGDLLAECMEKNGGFVSAKDLTEYRVVERAPICGRCPTGSWFTQIRKNIWSRSRGRPCSARR